MNKLLIALFFVCAMTDVVVGATPGQVTSNAWFSAIAASGETGGSFSPSGKPDVEGSKYVIASELATPVTFATENEPDAQDYAEVTFVLDTTVVPSPLAELTNKKVAFAVSLDEEEERAYYAWFGSSWTKLSGTPKADGESYMLVVTFDNREGNKVQFKVDDVVLKDADDDDDNEWFDYGDDPISNKVSIDLVGNGTLTSFIGKQIEIKTEIVAPTDCGPIEIPEADLALFKKKLDDGETIDAYMAAKAYEKFDDFAETTDVSVGAAYALGLLKSNDGKDDIVVVDGGVLKAMAVAQSKDTGNLALALNVDPPTTGAQISYQVFKNGGDTAISNKLSIPKDKLDEGLTKFTVKAIITPKQAN